MRELMVWLWVVLDHWQVLITGGATTALLVIVQAKRQKAFSWSLCRGVFFIFLLWAFFASWRDEHRARAIAEIALRDTKAAIEKANNQVPQLQHSGVETNQTSSGTKSPNISGTNGGVSLRYGPQAKP
jgi:hypothetical protein